MENGRGQQDYIPDREPEKDSRGYTKGEWKATDWVMIKGERFYDIETDEEVIATGVIEANAHLIAAAPDMYEALKEGIEELLTCEQEAQTEEQQSRIESTRHIIEEALAKAEGKLMEYKEWERPCGCKIVQDTTIPIIQHCPLHKAAPDMREALKGIVAEGTRACQNGEYPVRSTYNIDLVDRLARQALAKAREV